MEEKGVSMEEEDTFKFLMDYIRDEAVETVDTLEHILRKKFPIICDDARDIIEAWASTYKDVLKYDPNFNNGEGLIEYMEDI